MNNMNSAFQAHGQPTVVSMPATVKALLLICPPFLGLVLGYFLPAIAKLALTLPWIPFEGPIRLITFIQGPWAAVLTTAVGLIAGLLFTFAAFNEAIVVTVSNTDLQLKKDGTVLTFPRGEVAGVFLDGKQLVVLGAAGQELAREQSDLEAGRIAEAVERHGFRWLPEGDPYKETYRRWVEDTPDLPPAVNVLMKAREKALHKKDAADAKELRREAAKLGVVIRDEGARQYWRILEK